MFQAIANRKYPARQSGIARPSWPLLFKRSSLPEYILKQDVSRGDTRSGTAVQSKGNCSLPGLDSREKIKAPEITSGSDNELDLRGRDDQEKELNRRAVTRRTVCEGLDKISALCSRMGQDTSPLFVKVGQDLQAVFHETKALTGNIGQFGQRLNSSGEENGSLGVVRQLIRNVKQSLRKDQHDIEYERKLVGRLLTDLVQVRQVYELIDRISASFRVIRINIQIQCNANAISDDLFQGLADDITSLSQRLDRIAKQITQELFASERNMTSLNKSVADNLLKIEEVADQAERSIANAFAEIERLVRSAAANVKEAGEKSRILSGTVGKVVVSLQFHDSMSQRLDAIGKGIDQVRQLFCEGDEHEEILSGGRLGTAHLVLHTQQPLLDGLIDEIRSVRENIQCSFEVMEEEVRKLDTILQLLLRNGDGRQNFQAQSSSLQKDFLQLFELFSLGKKIKREIHSSTAKARNVADQLVQFSGDMKDINDDTKLQAVNTIIMAISLGEKGRTIEVLAKEISSLADETSMLTDQVTGIQGSILDQVDTLSALATETDDGTSYINNLEKELEQFSGVYSQIDEHVGDVSQQIAKTCEQINSIRNNLGFLDRIEEELLVFAKLMKQETDRLEPWKNEELFMDSSIFCPQDKYPSDIESVVTPADESSGAGKVQKRERQLFGDEERNTDLENGLLEDAENIEFF